MAGGVLRPAGSRPGLGCWHRLSGALQIPLFRFPRAILVAVLALAPAAAACGGGDSAPAEATDAPATTPAPAATPAPTPAPPPQATDAPATDTTIAVDSDRVVREGDAISVHYVGTLDDGEEFDSSRRPGRAPLAFVVGDGRMISGFDAAVRGMMVSEIKTVRLEPEEAYGAWTEALVITIDLAQLPPDIAVGDRLTSADTGRQYLVLEVTETAATLDGNHRLAGQALTFEIELVSFDAPAP